MANNLGVSIDKLISTVGVLREQKGVMKGKLSAVSTSITELRGSWDSPAAQSLQGIASQMQGRFDELEKEVDAFANVLDGIIRNYQANEAKNEAVMDQVMGAFSG